MVSTRCDLLYHSRVQGGQSLMHRLFFPFLILLSLAGVCHAQTQTPSTPSPQSRDRVVQLLKELTEASGPPGFEEAVRKIMSERMHPFADSITYDGLGSIIAQQGTSGPRIMLDPHMDVLGGMVQRIRPDSLRSRQMLG